MASYFETPDLGRTTQQLVELFEVQAECYGFIDIENTSSVIARIDARNVLDVGTGEGAFLLSLARRNPQRKFVGIDLNAEFIQVFNRRISESRLPNVQAIECELKENTDILDNDLVFCRLTAQHSADPISFLSNMKKGLRDGGWILCIEPIYKYYDSDPLAPVWKEYRERLFCSYRRMNSDPNIPMRVSGWLKDLGFANISTAINLYSPSTLGKERFVKVVIATAALLRAIHPDLWEAGFLQRIEAWLDELGDGGSVDPFIAIAHTLAQDSGQR